MSTGHAFAALPGLCPEPFPSSNLREPRPGHLHHTLPQEAVRGLGRDADSRNETAPASEEGGSRWDRESVGVTHCNAGWKVGTPREVPKGEEMALQVRPSSAPERDGRDALETDAWGSAPRDA